MTKWQVHVAHMAKHMNMMGAFFGGRPWARATWAPA